MPLAELYLSQSPHIAARTLGEDTVIMSTLDSTVYMLNSVGTAIWNAVNGKTPLSHIATALCAEFDVTAQEAHGDAKEFVDQLIKHGILAVSESPLAEAGQ